MLVVDNNHAYIITKREGVNPVSALIRASVALITQPSELELDAPDHQSTMTQWFWGGFFLLSSFP